MTDDPVRAENMHLRAQWSALRAEHSGLQREHDELSERNARVEARLAEVLGSSTWRLALRLVALAQAVPAPVRRVVSAGRRGMREPPQSAPAPLPEPAPLPRPAFPTHAQSYGMFTQEDATLAANPWHDTQQPRVSVIILNWNRSGMTLACVRYVLRHTAAHSFEVIVADNGSDPEDFAILQQAELPIRIIALGANLYFGEANNIAAERARGEYLFFLNNDAFVHDGWLAPLVAAIEGVPEAAAAGSQLRYPDGSLQEAGSLISPDGVSNQIGKGEDPADIRFNSMRRVDYVSAAAMLVRRRDFLGVLGFELCYEPAYYEDVDLCMKLRARGGAIVYCPASVVSHVENVTSQDARHGLRLDSLIRANRFTFARRWGAFLWGHRPPLATPPPYEPARSARPLVALHTPFMLRPGGSERYLLAVGEALRDVADVTLVTASPCSTIRLRRVGMDLGVDVSQIGLMTMDEARSGPQFDAAFVLGCPPPPGLARVNHSIWDALSGPGEGSGDDRHPSAMLIPPPVRLRRPGPKVRRILSVGRFLAGEHGRRQDVMVTALRALMESGAACELHLAGSLRPEPEHRAFYIALTEAAKDFPITLHPNIGAAELDELYGSSMILWHLTGLGSEPGPAPAHPAIMEAMSAGCVPVAFGAAETITDGQDGYVIEDVPGLLARTNALLDDETGREAMAARAMAKAARYDEAAFGRSIRALLSRDPPS